MFGILKATKNASVAAPEPNMNAVTMSRARPRILLRRVKNPTTNADLTILFLSEAIGWRGYISPLPIASAVLSAV